MTQGHAGTSQLQDVLIAPPLRIRYLPGSTKGLVVSFSGVGSKRHQEPPLEFYKIAGNGGKNHVLFITDINRSWLNTPKMAAKIVKVIEQYAKRINADSVTAIGNSMGGTMALHLSKKTRFDHVIALVPQYSVDPKLVPEETRWMFFRKQIKRYIFRSLDTLPDNGTLYFIVHGDTADEKVHFKHFPTGPMIAHFILPGMDHNLARTLHNKGMLKSLINHGIAGRRWRFRQTLETTGGILRRRYDARLAAYDRNQS